MDETPDLIDLVYASTIDPHRYDDLMACWQRHLDAALATSCEKNSIGGLADQVEIERHFNRGFAILERMGRQGAGDGSMSAMVDAEFRPAVLVDASGRILAVNGRAQTLFGVSSGDGIDALSLDAVGRMNIRKALSRIAREAPGRLLTVSRVLSPVDGSMPIVALTRVASATDPPLAMLSVADIAWSEKIGAMLRQVFGLTPAECDITRGMIAGLTPDRMAAARNRSEQTVRTQMKAVLRKLELRNQAELVRIIAGLTLMDAAPEHPGPTQRKEAVGRMSLRLGPARVLDVNFAGPPDGRPVLFLHGMLDGHGLTSTALSMLNERGIRLICPARPHFGGSSPDGGDAAGAPHRFAGDLAVILEHLGIPACPVVGHMSGSVYAFAAAARLGPLITRIVSVAGGVPIVSTSQFASMSQRQRLVARTARFSPKLLPLILRAGIALLDSGGDRAFMKALYASAPIDLDPASDPEKFAILRDGYRFTVAQGHRAFEIDAHHVVRDWTELATASTQPVLLVHGCHDPVVSVETVHAFSGRLGSRARVVEHPERGQLILYASPEFVINAIEQALN